MTKQTRNYALNTPPESLRVKRISATNRQKKLLNFFEIKFSPQITIGAAGWEIAQIMSNEENHQTWERYLYLTQDFGRDSDQVIEHDPTELDAVEVPEGWSATEAITKVKDDIVEEFLHNHAPFDCPQPLIEFMAKVFVFTGKFDFGSRKDCQSAVIEHGGEAPSTKSVSSATDYLVIGAQGSPKWRKGSYGNKIQAAILARREQGSPAIISEPHWVGSL